VFFNLYEPLNDAMDAARCMGSGFVARHSALADIGGWPLIDVGEDFMLSSCFHQAGWKTAYVGEKVQWGLAPESLCTHLKQKKRWVSKHFHSTNRLQRLTIIGRRSYRSSQNISILPLVTSMPDDVDSKMHLPSSGSARI